jgi:hypothetical protein
VPAKGVPEGCDIFFTHSRQAVRDLPVGELQRRLAADGVMIHYDFD